MNIIEEKRNSENGVLNSPHTSNKKRCSSEAEHTGFPVNSNIKKMKIQDDMESDCLMNDTQVLHHMFPDKDPNELYAILEAYFHHVNRLEVVVHEILSNENLALHPQDFFNNSGVNHSFPQSHNSCNNLNVDPFPQPHEYYNNLTIEPSCRHPQDSYNTQCIDLTFQTPKDSCNNLSLFPSYPLPSESYSNLGLDHLYAQPVKSNHDLTYEQSKVPTDDIHCRYDSSDMVVISDDDDEYDIETRSLPLESDLKELVTMFPDADPDFLYRRLEETEETDRINFIANYLLAGKYPKKIETNASVSNERQTCRKWFTIEEFLQLFPKPNEQFDKTDVKVSLNYKAHVEVYLKNHFPNLKKIGLNQLIKSNGHHLTCITDLLNNEMIAKLRLKKPNLKFQILDYPEIPDEYFFKEVFYIEHRNEIKDYFEHISSERKCKIEQAKILKELLVCNCCCEEELLYEDMVSCNEGHIFCYICVKKSTEIAIGDGQTKFTCLSGSPDCNFPLFVLKQVLPSNVYDKLLEKIQQEEIRQADIPDLVGCPFCPFATIMPDINNKIFKCLNSECLKESCRLCHKESHVPFRCNEVEKHDILRKKMEDTMTEALLRTCYNCKKPYIKTDGCNLITCPACKAKMCYVCRKPVKDYNHFEDKKCALHSDTDKMHDQEVKSGALEAKNLFLLQNPEQRYVADKLSYEKIGKEL